jgi:hypothetical protein
MAKTSVFKPRRTIYRVYDQRALVFACVCAALLRVAASVLFFKQPDLLPAVWERVILQVAVVGPVVLIVGITRSRDLWHLVLLSVTVSWFADAATAVVPAASTVVANLGVADSPLDDPLWFYLARLVLYIAFLPLAVRAMVAGANQLTWQIRIWTSSPLGRLLIPLSDRGAAWAIAAVLATGAAFVPLALSRAMNCVAIVLLVTPLAFELAWRRYRVAPAMPDDLSPVERQTWVCERLGVEVRPSADDRTVLATRGSWWDGPQILVHAGTGAASQWMICSGRVRWDKVAWSVPLSTFATIRPDLEPLLGLPPGWIATTEPVDVRYAPDVAERVANAMASCKVSPLPESSIRNARPIVV